MELKDQVNSYEQGIKLLELGVKSDSLYNWYMDNNPGAGNPYLSDYHGYEYDPFDADWDKNKLKKYNAYTVAELGKMLEKVLEPHPKLELKINAALLGTCQIFEYISEGKYKLLCDISLPTEAQSKGDSLIWLIENNYIKVSEINQ